VTVQDITLIQVSFQKTYRDLSDSKVYQSQLELGLDCGVDHEIGER
jgi:hypothetical protein